MPAVTLTASFDGQTFPVDLSRVTALDAAVYEQATGKALDLALRGLIERCPESDADWRLLDRALLKWLFVRQAVNPDAGVAEVLASVTFLPASDDPPAPEGAGAPVAPEAPSDGDVLPEKAVERAVG